SKVRLQPKNQLAKQFQLTPGQLIEDVRNNFEGGKSNSVINLLVESGPKLLLEMINKSLVDYLYLTVNLTKKGENSISVDELIKSFNLIRSESKDGFEFRCYQKLSY
ncbi:MAG: pyrimidine reductase, partial [Candidatus Nanopelagicus sp.]